MKLKKLTLLQKRLLIITLLVITGLLTGWFIQASIINLIVGGSF